MNEYSLEVVMSKTNANLMTVHALGISTGQMKYFKKTLSWCNDKTNGMSARERTFLNCIDSIKHGTNDR